MIELNILTWAKQKIRSPKPPQFDNSQWVVAVKEGNSTVSINGKIEKARCELCVRLIRSGVGKSIPGVRGEG